MFAPTYLDENATTPLDPAVLDAMLPFLTAQHGNPSSRHEYGRVARAALDRAREQIAAALGAHPTEVVLTSGGTEANNLMIKGAAESLPVGRMLVGATEHPSVLAPARQMARRGWVLDYFPVDGAGLIDLGSAEHLVGTPVDLVSVMLANNETGVVHAVPELAQMAHAHAQARGGLCWFHTDAVQAFGKMPLDFRALNRAGVHALTVSAHKIGGPKGAGALVVDKRVELQPLLAGGGHERGLRSGTENVAALVGFGAACERLSTRLRQVLDLRSRQEALESGLLAMGAMVFGRGAPRLPNTSFFALPGIDGETLVGRLDRAGFAVASGSACSSAQPEPSHVLAAMGVDATLSRGAVRVSFGPQATAATVEQFLGALQHCVQGLRGTASMAVAA